MAGNTNMKEKKTFPLRSAWVTAHGYLFCDGRTGVILVMLANRQTGKANEPQDLCPEECTLGLLNDLLVH